MAYPTFEVTLDETTSNPVIVSKQAATAGNDDEKLFNWFLELADTAGNLIVAETSTANGIQTTTFKIVVD